MTWGLALLAVAIGSLFYILSTLANASGWVNHTVDVRLAIERVRSLVGEADVEEHSFALTGSAELKESLARARTELTDALHGLRSLTADNPAQQTTLASIDRTV